MKSSFISQLRSLVAFVALALTVALVAEAHAGALPVQSVSLDEAGNGSITFNNNATFALPSSMAADPGPGGRASALTYFLSFSVTAGDLFLTDASGISDVIRFNVNPNTFVTSLVFYSLAGGSALADTGFPSAFYANRFTLPENLFGATSYTPGPGQPGFIGGNSIPATYFITSPAAVPEGSSSICLLAAAVVALLVVRLRLGTN